MSQPDALVFDFDFTLADSSRGIFRCTNLALAEMDIEMPSQSDVRPLIGLTLQEMFIQMTGMTNNDSADRFSARFHHHAYAHMAGCTTIYADVPMVMSALRANDIRTAIVSTKRRHRIEEILDLHNMRDQFDFVVGAEDVCHAKPDPEGLIMAVEMLAVDRSAAIYAGDHPVDGVAAQAAGIPFIAVLSGSHGGQDFAECRDRRIVNGVGEIPEFLGLA
jgi:phosphoglycolate phosphatase